MSKITVYRSSPYVIEKKASSFDASISFEELRSWIRSGKIFSHLFRYKTALMVTYDLRLISKPFASALLMRSLARRKAIRTDRKGKEQKITVGLLTSLFLQMVGDFLKKRHFLKKIEREVREETPSLQPQKLNLSHPPLYLRTDFCFGLQSGGSVGHIAGVLNQLSQFTAKPIFLTTDPIPTVNPEWESHTIMPSTTFWDFSELPPLYFNRSFFNQAVQILGTRRPSFIYQRYSINNFSGIRLAKHYGVPFVLEFNGSEIWVNRHWGNHTLKYETLAKKIEVLNLQASTLIVVVSQPLKDQLVTEGIASEKILVNPNGVNPEAYAPEINGFPVRQQYHLEEKTVLGFIGTFGKWHGAEVLAEAFGKLLKNFPEYKNRIRLLMIGDGMLMPLVKETLLKWNVSDATVLTGTVSQEAGPAHLAACDILVAPHVPNADGSRFFGSPTKLFEYMAMGKGIVASDLDQIGEILQHNQTAWMTKPGDSDSLMNGLKALIDDPVRRISLGQAARKEVVAHYTWKEHTRKIIDALSCLRS